MAAYDKRIDAYIAKSADFAKPVLEHIRELVHKACPEVEETVKWGFPHFEYKGILCSMAAFKQHCAFGFWKGSVMDDPQNIISTVGRTALGNFNRITSLKDLPADKILFSYVRQAAKLNDNDVKVPSKKVSKAKAIAVPSYFKTALQKNKKALAAFEAFSTSHRNEYVAWIKEAKTDETRQRRIATALEWLAEGKSRDWKYERKKA